MHRAAVAKEEREKAAIKSAGRVHYSWPSRPDVDVRAEVELQLGKGVHSGLDKAKTAAAKSLIVYHESLYAGAEGAIKVTDEEVGALLAKFTSLEELHWHNGYMAELRVRAMLAAALHLECNLKVLSLPNAELDPEALAVLVGCKAVQALNLRSGFSPLHCDFGCCESDEETPLLYDEPLSKP